MKPRVTLVLGSLFGLLALVLVLGGADTAHATTFNPTYTVSLADPAAGAHSDWTSDFNLPDGDVNFAGIVFFIPPEWEITPGEEVPIGAVVGNLTATATLGVLNQPCATPLPVEFNMLNSSIDPSDTVSFVDADSPEDEGYDDEDVFEDKDESGLLDAFEKYPDFITRVLVDEDDQPLTPIRRSAGIAIVAGVNVLLQFLVFEPGTFIDEDIPFDESLGYPSVTLLQNAGDPDFDPVPGAITDFCTPLITTNTSFGISKDNACTDVPGVEVDPLCDVTSTPLEVTGESESDPDEGGIVLFTNPPEGTYTFTTIGFGQRDADGDGYENSLDTCNFDPNLGNPRIGGDADEDSDGLDAACDPDDSETNSDEDLDGYLNRQDNCPLVPNGENEDNQRDTDDDTIGDACDPNPEDPDTEGQYLFAEVSMDVTIGPGTASTEETPDAGETPEATLTPSESDEDGGGGSSAIIIIVVVIAAVAVVGGGAFLFVRRRST